MKPWLQEFARWVDEIDFDKDVDAQILEDTKPLSEIGVNKPLLRQIAFRMLEIAGAPLHNVRMFLNRTGIINCVRLISGGDGDDIVLHVRDEHSVKFITDTLDKTYGSKQTFWSGTQTKSWKVPGVGTVTLETDQQLVQLNMDKYQDEPEPPEMDDELILDERNDHLHVRDEVFDEGYEEKRQAEIDKMNTQEITNYYLRIK